MSVSLELFADEHKSTTSYNTQKHIQRLCSFLQEEILDDNNTKI
ncbi:hypothetical protein FLA_3773 [Filimonas lacunae]|nr:hypothetical protein FLA_3773 [Filimonas lacunae]